MTVPGSGWIDTADPSLHSVVSPAAKGALDGREVR